MIIGVGSTNPVKIRAAQQACEQVFPSFEIVSKDVASGVSAQPRSDEETRLGAHNRAVHVLDETSADLAIGIEGGVQDSSDGLLNSVWICVMGKDRVPFYSNGVRFLLPKKVADAIYEGQEMGPALDALTQQKDTKKNMGMVGLVTQGIVGRAEAYTAVIKLALGLFQGRDWEQEYERT